MKVWQDTRHIFYEKIPLWYAPLEAVSRRMDQREIEVTYAQILEDDERLKTCEELNLNWWSYSQIKLKFETLWIYD